MNEPLLRRVLGEVLRSIRLGQGRTLQQVATTAQVSMPYLSEVERGLKEASSEVLAAICRALEIRVADLVTQAHEEFLAAHAAADALELRSTPGRFATDRRLDTLTLTAVPAQDLEGPAIVDLDTPTVVLGAGLLLAA